MCGRYRRIFSDEEITASYWQILDDLDAEPGYNIAPGTFQPVIRQTAEGRIAERYWWGLVPSWAKDKSFGALAANARAETVATKPAFREAFRRRRCLVPADGYYEWQTIGARKQPYLFQMASKAPFAFGGLWESWNGPQGELRSFCLITTRPNALAATVHDRMPVIIERNDWDRWLDLDLQRTSEIESLLQPIDAEEMIRHPVNTLVNSSKNQGPEVCQPIPSAEGFTLES